MRRILGVIACVLVAASLSAACGGNPTNASAVTDAAAFLGTWQNVDSQTGSIPQIVITMQGSQLGVHAYGACVPTLCDWGQLVVPAPSNGMLSLTWQPGFDVSTQVLTVVNGQLHSTLHTHFTDGSGRTDYDAIDVFNKTS